MVMAWNARGMAVGGQGSLVRAESVCGMMCCEVWVVKFARLAERSLEEKRLEDITDQYAIQRRVGLERAPLTCCVPLSLKLPIRDPLSRLQHLLHPFSFPVEVCRELLSRPILRKFTLSDSKRRTRLRDSRFIRRFMQVVKSAPSQLPKSCCWSRFTSAALANPSTAACSSNPPHWSSSSQAHPSSHPANRAARSPRSVSSLSSFDSACASQPPVIGTKKVPAGHGVDGTEEKVGDVGERGVFGAWTRGTAEAGEIDKPRVTASRGRQGRIVDSCGRRGTKKRAEVQSVSSECLMLEVR